MSSIGNYLSLKSHLSDFKSGSDKDTISEASSGTSNFSNNEDLQKLAIILGLPSVDDVHQEKIRVDRKRLEAMLSENLEEAQTATAFFHQVMNETSTIINWPARLKVGARSKKDPHVRIAGRLEDVRSARDRIMQLLDTRSNRVTMKLDVSYTDHSHIIGKGGQTIKRVMEETSCHIHFPDSNRSSAMEKSNQVSIAGNMDHVEKARAKLRSLTPLIFSFELPIMKAPQPLPDVNSPYVMKIQEQYHVQVMLRTRAKLHSSLVVVKGVQWEVDTVMEATRLLINYMCGPLANQTCIQMSLEISPMHHSTILGHNATQLKAIMHATTAQIMFPDAEDPNVPTIKKSNVVITGNIQDVYTARQQLVGCLPLVIMFDLNEEQHPLDAEMVNSIMLKCNVFITVRRKPTVNISSVVIKGIERSAVDIYEARRLLLGGKDKPIEVDVPESYFIPQSALNSVASVPAFNPFSPSHNLNLPTSPLTPVASTSFTNLQPLTINHMANIAGAAGAMYPAPTSPLAWHVLPPSPPAWPIMNPLVNGMQQPMYMPPFAQPHYVPSSNSSGQPSMMSVSSISPQGTSSGYHSNFTNSNNSLDAHNMSGGDTSHGGSNVSPAVSPISKTHSPTPTKSDSEPNNAPGVAGLANMLSDLSVSDRRAVGCEKKTLENIKAQMSPFANYQQLKSEAEKAMRDPINENYRVPTTRYSGCFFSQTSPGVMNLNQDVVNTETESKKKWDYPDTLTRPNIMEVNNNTPTKALSSPSPPTKDLNTILKQIGLDKYIHLFEQHEIDVSTFKTLTDSDLSEIGVAAFGARRKILLTIAALKSGGEIGSPSQASPSFYQKNHQQKWQ